MTRLVYILAASHSGSTLLAMLLGTHPEICTVGELKATSLGDVNRYRCSCRKEIKKCPFWEAVARDVARRGFPFDINSAGTDLASGASRYARRLLRPLHRGPLFERFRDIALSLSANWRYRLPHIQALNAGVAESICLLTGTNVIVDSSKVGLRLKYLLRNPALDVLVIRLIRDGKAVALTYTDPATFADASEPDFRCGGMGGDWRMARLSLRRAALQWRRSNEEAEDIIRRLDKNRWIEVRYESLCAEPETALRRVFAFIGVEPWIVNLDFRSVEHHIIGNGMRLDSSSKISLDERWRSALGERDLKIFERMAGEMNRRLGYH